MIPPWIILAKESIPFADSPKTVVFRDEGDGLRCVAIHYDRPEVADQAFDILWKAWQHGVDPYAPSPRKAK